MPPLRLQIRPPHSSLQLRARHTPPQLVPSALSNVGIVDGGNASPAFMRITMNQVPKDKDLCVSRLRSRRLALAWTLTCCGCRYNRCKIPLAAVLQPLNDAPGCNVGWTEFPTGNAGCSNCQLPKMHFAAHRTRALVGARGSDSFTKQKNRHPRYRPLVTTLQAPPCAAPAARATSTRL
jgi:hypothetical protein